MIRDKNGNAFILEVNGNPGTKIIDITGHNYFDDLVSLIEKRVNYKASESTVGKQASLQQVKQFAKIQGNSETELNSRQHLRSKVLGFISRSLSHKQYPKLVYSLSDWWKAA